MGVPQVRWMVFWKRENPTKIDDFGVPPILGNHHVISVQHCTTNEVTPVVFSSI